MTSSHSLRSRFAILIALLVASLSWLLGTLIGHDASQRIREEVGRDLAEVSFMMVDRLDRDMQSRAAMLQVIGKLRALRQPDDIVEVRVLLDRLQTEFPSIAWIGFSDAQGKVLSMNDYASRILQVKNEDFSNACKSWQQCLSQEQQQQLVAGKNIRKDLSFSIGNRTISLAATFSAIRHPKGDLQKVIFYGTDINNEVLNEAKNGIYSLRKMKIYTENFNKIGLIGLIVYITSFFIKGETKAS